MTSEIGAIRRFNRTVTERIGALNDEYLARARPLGASRLLWEIGSDGSDARALRARLGLDSGYLSRLLRSLEQEGLIEVCPSLTDRRVRVIRLTPAGAKEKELLDRRSDDLAESLLAPLDERQRSTLVAAVQTVERLLTAGLVRIEVEDPESDAAHFCLASYFEELDARFDTGFDPSRSISAASEEIRHPRGLFIVARLREEPVGCGALKLPPGQPAEVKRMWVKSTTRGLGVGRRILSALESHARERGVELLRLETNRALVEAIDLYRSSGYMEVEPFNSEPYAHHWFEKRLT